MAIYGYLRCSTNETKQDISRQAMELHRLGVPDTAVIYQEYASGTKEDRAQLKALLDTVQEGDTIVATEVSRLTRSTKQLCELIELAKNKHLKLVIGSFVVDCSKGELDAMTNGMLKMMGVFAEMERDMITERIKSGMANAKAKGRPIGKPKMTYDDLPQVFIKQYPLYKSKQINQIQLARLCNVTRQTIAKYSKIYEGYVHNELAEEGRRILLEDYERYRSS